MTCQTKLSKLVLTINELLADLVIHQTLSPTKFSYYTVYSFMRVSPETVCYQIFANQVSCLSDNNEVQSDILNKEVA